MLEEEVEFARVRDAKVMFAVDSLDMSFADAEINATERDARRDFWRQYAIRRVTESRTTRSIGQSLGERELRTDSVDELGWFANARHHGATRLSGFLRRNRTSCRVNGGTEGRGAGAE